MEKIEKVAPKLAEKFSRQELEAIVPLVIEEAAEPTEPKLTKECILEVIKYVQYLDQERVNVSNSEYLTNGPSDISKRLKRSGFEITPQKVKELTKEFRAVRSVLSEPEPEPVPEPEPEPEPVPSDDPTEPTEPTEPTDPLDEGKVV